ncbi:MAG: type II toxin-antitoxin system VapC family toxin [Acidobacteria bacterium]|nr:type II toxin-antitoxin system VapC family toxin [Acidobacteriota bacterium]
MSFLIDTNVLLRLADNRSPEHTVAEAAIEHLLADKICLFISTQVLVEFWSVATRPESVNGLGWSTATAAEGIRALREQFPLLAESPAVLDRWFEIVDRCHVAGKRTHDARLAALLLVHGLERLLTFNTSDFPRSWGIDAEHPKQFVASSTD